MRRPLSTFLRALRDDSGLTAVEYAMLAGLIIAVCGAGAFWLGQNVSKTSSRVTWGKGPTSSVHFSSQAAVSTHIAPSSGTSTIPLALLSLGISVGGVAGFAGWYFFRDSIRQGRTRRIVRGSFTGANVQAAMERIVRNSSREPAARLKRPDTNLIGRNSPDLHHWVKGQDVSVSGRLASNPARAIGPETDGQLMARLRPTSPLPVADPLPAVNAAG